jgi:hypothetical protein
MKVMHEFNRRNLKLVQKMKAKKKSEPDKVAIALSCRIIKKKEKTLSSE